jgi:hypothetical protein
MFHFNSRIFQCGLADCSGTPAAATVARPRCGSVAFNGSGSSFARTNDDARLGFVNKRAAAGAIARTGDRA